MERKNLLPHRLAVATAMIVLCLGSNACEPASIDTVFSNGPICPGDHVDLSVSATGDIIGYSWAGPGTGEFFSFSSAFSFLTPVTGEYTIVVFSDCGNDTARVTIDAKGAGAGNGAMLSLCDNGLPTSMEALLGPHDPGGAWTYFGEPHGPMFDPLVDQAGPYLYTVADSITCPGANPVATVAVQLTRVGPAGSGSICAIDEPVDLAGFLSPDHTLNGQWHTFDLLSMVAHAAMYDPAVDSSGVFIYAVSGCTTSVSIAEQAASIWYADLDHDGLGDIAQQLLACTVPPDHVADSTDACASLSGTIGQPCDDGDSITVNDHITPDCQCAGDLPTTIVDSAMPSPLNAWPNPYAEGVLHVAYEGTDLPLIEWRDMHGRRIRLAEEPVRSGATIGFTPPQDLAPGAYLVRLVSRTGIRTAQVLVL